VKTVIAAAYRVLLVDGTAAQKGRNMETVRVVVLGYERTRVDIYEALLEDEGYEVYVLYPCEEHVNQMDLLKPQLVLVDVTQEYCDVGSCLFQWLGAHEDIRVLFCRDRDTTAPAVLHYLEVHRAVLYSQSSTFLRLEDFVDKVHQALVL
jgi:DNA-binding NtrC family response regulator